MAREHNVIQQQDRRRNLQPARYLPCRYIQPASNLPNINQRPAKQKPATCPSRPLQPAQQNPATCPTETSNLPNRTLPPAN